VLNIGSALSLLPVVGVTLPLVSYGGSALIATYMGVGFVASSALRNPAILVEVKRAVAKRRAHK
jgi:cell division protein FtsW